MRSTMAIGRTVTAVTIGPMATMATDLTATGTIGTGPMALVHHTGIAAGIIDGTVTRGADRKTDRASVRLMG